MDSEHMLKTRIKPTLYEKLCSNSYAILNLEWEIFQEKINIYFFAILLVYDKSNQHKSIYTSYNVELASAKLSQSLLKMSLTDTVHIIV